MSKDNNEEELIKDRKKKKASSYTCPNCGASIESYTSNCPYCQTEIRDVKSSEAIEKFIQGLERIQSKEMPKYEGKESFLKKTIGVDLSKEEEAREIFENNFKEKINNEVANYINNYPVPNSKEDLIEFMILVTSNINSQNDDSDEVKKAWKSKMEQIYKKSKLTLKKPDDVKIVEELYNSKKQELKNNKVDKGFYISIVVCLYIALMISIANWLYGLSFVFFSLGIMTILSYLIKGKGAKIFKTPINLTKTVVIFLLIFFMGISLFWGVKGYIKANTHSKEYNDYYNETVEKYDVEVEIDFDGNLFFNKYDVKLSIYDQEIKLPHGKNKTVNLKLPNGKHRLKFAGDGMAEYADLNVEGNTKVKYKISCHSDEIKVFEVEVD